MYIKYNIVSNENGCLSQVDLFTMHGPAWAESFMSFEMRLIGVQAGRGVQPADLNCFE